MCLWATVDTSTTGYVWVWQKLSRWARRGGSVRHSREDFNSRHLHSVRRTERSGVEGESSLTAWAQTYTVGVCVCTWSARLEPSEGKTTSSQLHWAKEAEESRRNRRKLAAAVYSVKPHCKREKSFISRHNKCKQYWMICLEAGYVTWNKGWGGINKKGCANCITRLLS